MTVPFWNRWQRRWTRWTRQWFPPGQIQNGRVRIDMRQRGYSPQERRQLYSDQYEICERRIVEQRLRPNDIVLELGSGVGIVTITCCQIVGSERVHAFEANPQLEAVLHRNFELNGVNPHLQMGMISSATGTGDFHVSDFFLSSCREESATRASTAKFDRITVPAVSLQQVLQEIRPTFLVVDIEGGELEFLNPEVDLSSVERICLEVHPKKVGDEPTSRLIEHLIQRGFGRSPQWSEGNVLYFERGTRTTEGQRAA